MMREFQSVRSPKNEPVARFDMGHDTSVCMSGFCDVEETCDAAQNRILAE